MWRALLITLPLCLAATLPSAAEPDCAQPIAPGATLMRSLMDWIGQNSPYTDSPALTRLPGVAFCNSGEAIPLDGDAVLVEPNMRAAYDPGQQRLFLTLPWEPSNTFDRSILLHELVHHVQLQSRPWPCINAAEWEAYRLQDQWLREHGVVHEFDWLRIYFMSRCPHNPHAD